MTGKQNPRACPGSINCVHGRNPKQCRVCLREARGKSPQSAPTPTEPTQREIQIARELLGIIDRPVVTISPRGIRIESRDSRPTQPRREKRKTAREQHGLTRDDVALLLDVPGVMMPLPNVSSRPAIPLTAAHVYRGWAADNISAAEAAAQLHLHDALGFKLYAEKILEPDIIHRAFDVYCSRHRVAGRGAAVIAKALKTLLEDLRRLKLEPMTEDERERQIQAGYDLEMGGSKAQTDLLDQIGGRICSTKPEKGGTFEDSGRGLKLTDLTNGRRPE